MPFPTPAFLGTPQEVPDLVIVVRHPDTLDTFATNAIEYHRQWGLYTVTADSIEDILAVLSSTVPTPGRIRLAVRGHVIEPNDPEVEPDVVALDLRLFTDGPNETTTDDLRAWMISDVDGLRHTLRIPDQVERWIDDLALTNLRQKSPDVLRPFGLDIGTGTPIEPLRSVFRSAVSCCAAEMNALTLESGRFDLSVREVLYVYLRTAEFNAVDSDASEEEPPSLRDVRALTQAILGLKEVFNGINPQPIAATKTPAEALRYEQGVLAAGNGVRRGWRHALLRARDRISDGLHLDVVGVEIGKWPKPLRQFATFFNADGKKLTVTGPKAPHIFGLAETRLLHEEAADFGFIASDPTVRRALLHWATVTDLVPSPQWPLGPEDELERNQLMAYLGTMRVLPAVFPAGPAPSTGAQVTFYVATSYGNFDPEDAKLWLRSQWTAIGGPVVADLVRRWSSGGDWSPGAKLYYHAAVEPEQMPEFPPYPPAFLLSSVGSDPLFVFNSGSVSLPSLPPLPY